jgi:hypothetical protein
VGGVQLDDLWSDDEEKTLWTAKLFPILQHNLGAQGDTFSLSDKMIHANEVFSVCCWFMKVENRRDLSPETALRPTERWKNSHRLSLKDLLTCGDGAQMLQWRLFVFALCQSASSSCSSSLRSILYWSSAHRIITDLLHLMRTTLFTHFTPQTMSICASFVLGLSLTRLCLRDSSIALNSPPLQTVFPNSSPEVLDSLIKEFDCAWDRLSALDLVFVTNSYLVQLLEFYSPNTSLLEVMRCTAPSLSFTEYPRYLLLLDWLLEKGILSLSQVTTDIQPRQSPAMLSELLSLLKINQTHLPRATTHESLVPLAQVGTVSSVLLCSPHH